MEITIFFFKYSGKAILSENFDCQIINNFSLLVYYLWSSEV